MWVGKGSYNPLGCVVMLVLPAWVLLSVIFLYLFLRGEGSSFLPEGWLLSIIQLHRNLAVHKKIFEGMYIAGTVSCILDCLVIIFISVSPLLLAWWKWVVRACNTWLSDAQFWPLNWVRHMISHCSNFYFLFCSPLPFLHVGLLFYFIYCYSIYSPQMTWYLFSCWNLVFWINMRVHGFTRLVHAQNETYNELPR